MVHYIDKDALVAEIESKKKYAQTLGDNAINGSMQQFYDGMKQGCVDLLSSIDTLKVKELQEEPVSEELEEACRNYADDEEYGDDVYFAIKAAFKVGAEWKKNHIWKPADGDDLPEYEREVVVFTQNFPNDAGMMMVAIGHRPTPEGFDGKSLTTGKVEYYTPKTYDKGGWNIPNTKYWLDVELPKEIEL